MGFAPLNSGQVEGDRVTTGAMPWLLGAGLFLRQPTSARIAVDLGAGVLLAWLDYSTGPRADLMPLSTPLGHAVSGYARVGADLAFTRSLALRLDLMGGVTFMRATFDDPAVKHVAWNHTFAAALGGVEARWF